MGDRHRTTTKKKTKRSASTTEEGAVRAENSDRRRFIRRVKVDVPNGIKTPRAYKLIYAPRFDDGRAQANHIQLYRETIFDSIASALMNSSRALFLNKAEVIPSIAVTKRVRGTNDTSAISMSTDFGSCLSESPSTKLNPVQYQRIMDLIDNFSSMKV
jgi:hypothetical protein